MFTWLKHFVVSGAVFCVLLALPVTSGCAATGDVMDLGQEQAKEKMELEEMKSELGGVRGTMGEAVDALNQVSAQMNRPKIKEFRLAAREGSWELFPGTQIEALTYNGQIPGPSIRVKEGDFVRIVLQNDLKVPTSLHFHGLILPGSVDGLPRAAAGLVPPGKAYAYQFQALQPGTFWYHPQVVNSDQLARGLYGAIVVEPANVPQTYERDYLVVLGQCLAAPRLPAAKAPKSLPSSQEKAIATPPAEVLDVISPSAGVPPSAVTYFTINGKSAPAIPPLEVHKGERIRLRVVNASQQVCPLHLSGHKFEVISTNGGDGLEPHVNRDTVAVQPGDRFDLEFTADNPGNWSLSSILTTQTNNNGKFPGGIACVVRYVNGAQGK